MKTSRTHYLFKQPTPRTKSHSYDMTQCNNAHARLEKNNEPDDSYMYFIAAFDADAATTAFFCI